MSADKFLGLNIMAVVLAKILNKRHFISQKYKPYPQLRLVGLMATETRMMMGAAFDACSVGEATLARRLLGDVPANSLTLFLGNCCYRGKASVMLSMAKTS